MRVRVSPLAFDGGKYMQITVANISELECKLKIEVPIERIETAVQKEIRKIVATVNVPGFRKGKAPFDVVQRRYGAKMRDSVIADIIEETLQEALQQEDIFPVDKPQIEFITNEAQKPLCYVASFIKLPKVCLLFDKSVEKYCTRLTSDDIDAELEKLCKSHTVWQKVDRKSQAGDQLSISYNIKTHDPAVEREIQQEDVEFVLGEDEVWSDFAKPLYGVSAGETKQYTLLVPPSHIDRDLAGKEAEFSVNVRQVCEPIVPPLDDNLAKKVDSSLQGLEDLKVNVVKDMKQQVGVALTKLTQDNIIKRLLEDNPLASVPESLVEEELQRMAKSWREFVATNWLRQENAPVFPCENFKKLAQDNMRAGLLLCAVARQHKISITQKELQNKVKNDLARRDNSELLMKNFFADDKLVHKFKTVMLDEKIFTFLCNSFQMIEKEISYKEALERSEMLELI